MVRILVKSKCIQNSESLNILFEKCIPHLGNDKFEVRQEAMRLFITMMKFMPSTKFIQKALGYINCENWRMKEEILNLLII